MRVLIYSPYSLWPQHAYFERMLEKKLNSKGVPTLLLTCNGILDFCEQYTQCFKCKLVTRRLDEEIGKPSTKLSTYLKKTNPHNEETVYKGLDLHQMVLSSYLSRYRLTQFEMTSVEQTQGYKKLIQSAKHFMDAILPALDEFKPTHVVVLNGRFFTHRILFEIAKLRNIRIVTHELGSLKNSMQFQFDEKIHSYKHILQLWDTFKDMEMHHWDFVNTVNVINHWRMAKNRSGAVFNVDKSCRNAIREIKDRISQYDKTYLILTSSDDEFAAVDEYNSIFESQIAWLEQTIRFFKKKRNYFGIIRIHPNTVNKEGKLVKMVDFINSLKRIKLPENVLLIDHESKINTYELMEIANVGVTYGSTASIEMFMMKKPVMICNQFIFYHLAFFDKTRSTDEYDEDLEKLVRKDVSNEDLMSGVKFFYLYYIHISHPFHLIKFIGFYRPWLNFMESSEILQNPDMENIYEKMFNPQAQKMEKHGKTVAATNMNIHLRSKAKSILLISSLREKDFYSTNNSQSNYYSKLVLERGHAVEVLFPNDPLSQHNWLYRSGYFSGMFSNLFKKFYWTTFRFPYLSFINSMIKRTFKTLLHKAAGKMNVLEFQIGQINPWYIVSFANEDNPLPPSKKNVITMDSDSTILR